jgi:hypothetical protein
VWALWGVHPIDETNLFRSILSEHATESLIAVKKPDAMNTKKRSYEPKYATKNGAIIKTVSLQITVTKPDLQSAVREAFTLAKSAGRELNLAFNP